MHCTGMVSGGLPLCGEGLHECNRRECSCACVHVRYNEVQHPSELTCHSVVGL